jgi:hypothetical protein
MDVRHGRWEQWRLRRGESDPWSARRPSGQSCAALAGIGSVSEPHQRPRRCALGCSTQVQRGPAARWPSAQTSPRSAASPSFRRIPANQRARCRARRDRRGSPPRSASRCCFGPQAAAHVSSPDLRRHRCIHTCIIGCLLVIRRPTTRIAHKRSPQHPPPGLIYSNPRSLP